MDAEGCCVWINAQGQALTVGQRVEAFEGARGIIAELQEKAVTVVLGTRRKVTLTYARFEFDTSFLVEAPDPA